MSGYKGPNQLDHCTSGYFTPRVRSVSSTATPLRAGSLTTSIRVKVERAKDNLQQLDYEPGNPTSKAIVVSSTH